MESVGLKAKTMVTDSSSDKKKDSSGGSSLYSHLNNSKNKNSDSQLLHHNEEDTPAKKSHNRDGYSDPDETIHFVSKRNTNITSKQHQQHRPSNSSDQRHSNTTSNVNSDTRRQRSIDEGKYEHTTTTMNNNPHPSERSRDSNSRRSNGESNSSSSARSSNSARSSRAISRSKEGHSSSSKSSSKRSSNIVNYNARKVIGNGSFGVVFEATVVETGQVVAIKKVLQDKRFKNRELQIMRKLSHPNIVHLIHCFYSRDEAKDEVYLHLVLEYVPKTVWEICKSYHRSRKFLPIKYVKLYTYQLCRALAYIHSLGICHRDIKPQNLLVDTRDTHALKLCDFGSAKVLVKGEPNVAYICSRYYRAPELIFGCTDYTTEIDVWSLGCVVAEMLLSRPLFPGECGVDQLVEIIKVLGTPTKEQIFAMNKHYSELKFPDIKKNSWKNIFHNSTDTNAVDLVSKILAYDPKKRSKPLIACTHPFFDSLRSEGEHTKDFDHDLPPLFNLTANEVSDCSAQTISRLVPPKDRKGGDWEEIVERFGGESEFLERVAEEEKESLGSSSSESQKK